MSPSPAQKTFLIVALTVLYFLARFHHAPPLPLPHHAPDSVYSAERAFAHVVQIAAEPHPAGSAQADKVRDYIVEQVQALGLLPQIQETMVYRPPFTVATVHNVLARIAGTSGTGDAVALMAHYDSVVFGPGAADDGAGVSAMLEAMRALQAEPQPFNDIIFIFTDGEEGRQLGGTGLRGAYAFVEQHPWANDVRVVLNFDARGVKGPAYMYQTSGKNAWLIAQLARSRSKAAATSLAYEVYDRMPVGSDLSAFIDAGIPGYDCAFIHGLEKYHTMLDSPENLSLASLQHQGEYALTLTRHLAGQPLAEAGEAAHNLVYFDFPGSRVIHYNFYVALLLTIMTLVIYATLVIAGMRRNAITLPGFLGAAGCCLLWLFLCCGVSALVMVIGYRARGVYILYASDELTLGVLLICAGASILALNQIMDKAGIFNTLFGFLLPWASLLVLAQAFMPGATYAIAWPFLFVMPPLGVHLFFRSESDAPHFSTLLLIALAAFPTLLFTVGILTGFYAALLFIFVPLHTAVLLFAMTVMIFPLRIATDGLRQRVALGAVAMGLIATGLGVFWPGFSAQQPKFNSVAYGLNADTGEAFFMSCDDGADSWTENFLGQHPEKHPITEFIPVAERDYLKAPAPALSLPAPTVEVLDHVVEDNQRLVSLVVDSPRGAEVVEIYAMPETNVLAAWVNDTPMEITEAPWRLSYSIYRSGGIALRLALPAESPALFRVSDHQYYLERILDFEPRPPHHIPKPNTVDFNRDPLKSEESIVTKLFDLTAERTL